MLDYLSLKNLFAAASVIALSVTAVFAQTTEAPAKKVNFGYSQNPKTRQSAGTTETTRPQVNAVQSPVSAPETDARPETLAKTTRDIVKRASITSAAPTEIYKVGIGDVLFINLQNAPRASTVYTVLNDGTIDYPLAGELVPVLGMTTDEIEELLREKVKVFENPQLTVNVRDYASHSVKVLGLVERPGEMFLRREAMPLFAIRAEAIASPGVTTVTVRRPGAAAETFSLKESKWENVLVYAGDIIEFTAGGDAKAGASTGNFVIGGAVASPGQKNFENGLTLTQAILISGGAAKGKAKKAVISRRNADGLLTSTEFELKKIRDGKIPDPKIETGDTIEVVD